MGERGMAKWRRRAVGGLATWFAATTGVMVLVPELAPVARAAVVDATYQPLGPTAITGGQVENLSPSDRVAGAVHTVVAHPTDPDIAWLGATNGGVWRTNNATAVNPTWVPLTDDMPSLSIGALEMDPTIPTNTVLVAGIGRYASFGGIGGPRVGLLRTADGGTTWAQVGAAELTGLNISGVAPRGGVIVVSSNSGTNGGIWRRATAAGAFTRLSGNGTSGLPNQLVFDLVGDPTDPTVLYAAAATGIFRSANTGATWAPVTNEINSINGNTNNIEIAVHSNGNTVYAGVVNNGQLGGLWRSANDGGNWTQMDTPQTNEGGQIIGIQPREKPGSQGGTHFSILADITDTNMVYLGGDRQPVGAGPNGIGGDNDDNFPNSVGANDFSGRLFRCDANLAAGNQCSPLTHIGTVDGSAPHADSREMVFDANGDIIETDDGGINRRTDPETNGAGEWTGINGNLQISESQSCDYDSVGDLVLCGNQDTGAPEQSAAGSTTWNTLSAGDGGFVAVNDSGANSIRFSSSNSFGAGGFRRRTCTPANVCVNSAPDFIVAGSGGQTIQQFDANRPLYTPLAMNEVDQTRFIVTTRSVYESTDSLDNFTVVTAIPGVDGNGNPAVSSRAIAYGGRAGGADNPGVLWYGTNGAGGVGQLFLRTGGAGIPAAVTGWGTNGVPSDIVLNPENWAEAYVSQGNQVFHTVDAGATFTDITGNLGTEAPLATVRSLEVIPVPGTAELALLAGTDTGVFLTQTQNLGTWAELGADLPNTIAFDIKHDVDDDVLMVGTMGRGVWLLQNASQLIPSSNLRVTKSDFPDPVMAGEELFYTVTVTNDGPDDAIGVVVTDDLPDEVDYLEDSIGCDYDTLAHQLTCELGDIPAGESRSFTIKTRVHSDAVVGEDDGTIRIENVVTVGSISVDVDTSNNTFTTPTFVQERADLRLTKECKPDDDLRAGEQGVCTIFVDNLGPSSARDVELRDAVVSDGAFTVSNIVASQGSCSGLLNGEIICQLGDLAAASVSNAGRATVTMNVSANEDVDINDVADVRSPTPDPVMSNNEAREHISVMAVSDLSITKTGPADAIAGTPITYELSIANGGPSTAEGVVINDVLPLGVKVLSVSGSGNATCHAGTPGNALLPTTCSFGTLALSATRTMTIEVLVLPGTEGVIHNDARVDSATFDDDLSDNLDTVATNVGGQADLSISKTDSPDPVLAGNELTYTIVVTNGGPSTAEDVTITDELPAGTSFVEGVDGNGAGVCALVQPGIVTCDLGDMEPGDSVTVFLTVLVGPAVPPGTTLFNTASVTSSTNDPDPDNNSSEAETTVNTEAELWLDKQATQRSGNPSPVLIYSLTVHNDTGCETDAQSSPTPTCGSGGPSDALNVVVTDVLPLDPKKVVVQFTSPQCTYTKATHTVVCTSARVPAGAKVEFVIEAQVSGSVGTISNTASLTSSTPDPEAGNNTDSASIVMKGGTGKRGK